MKKLLKRIALYMLLSLCVAVICGAVSFADTPTKGSITIYTDNRVRENGDGVGGSVRLYLIFPAVIGPNSEGNITDSEGNFVGVISYTCTDEQKAIPGFDQFFAADAANNVSATDAAIGNDGKLSSGAVDFIKSHLSDLGKQVHIGNDSGSPYPHWLGTFWTAEGEPYTIAENLDFGYYYVSSTVGTAVMIDSTTPNAVIRDKNLEPKLDKTITGIVDADGVSRDENINHSPDPYAPYSDSATVQIGDTVDYELKVTARNGAEFYVLTDLQSPSLTLLPDTVTVKVGENDLDESFYDLYTAANPGYIWLQHKNKEPQELIPYSGFSYTPARLVSIYEYNPETESDVLLKENAFVVGNTTLTPTPYEYKCNILVAFKQAYLDTITSDTEITVRYKCRINELAKVATDYSQYDNENRALLHFGNRANDKEIPDWTRVYTARLSIFKYDGTGESSSSNGVRPLAGVTFVLKDSRGKYYQLSGAQEYEDPYGRGMIYKGTVKWVDENENPTILTTGANGRIQVEGLTNGTYTLSEVQQLPGYNKANDVEIVINNHNNTWAELKKQVDVANKTGSILPTTGGPGVLLYYVIGVGMITIGAAVILKKRTRDTV